MRLLLTQEPRSHSDMLAAIVTEPVSEEAAFGVVFMDACRYPYMCGQGTIGAVTTLTETIWRGTMGGRDDGGPPALVVPEVRGSAHITGANQFILDPGDPFPRGFLL